MQALPTTCLLSNNVCAWNLRCDNALARRARRFPWPIFHPIGWHSLKSKSTIEKKIKTFC